NFARQSVQSYVNVVKTESVLGPVIEELGLEESTGELAEKGAASARADTSLIDLKVQDEDQERAASIADAVSASLIDVVQEELEFSGAGESPVKITSVQPAVIPENAVSPRVPLNLALG